ncbi:Folliculin [Amphibalanus amphitrite]|uniref:Folliculin n=1 Tax=Amphibalanus amphitrite TaxID=1232801 RepID=A0A6A4VTE3_AMPAM|nr:Folliculin [Amphibalanus amphitrite]
MSKTWRVLQTAGGAGTAPPAMSSPLLALCHFCELHGPRVVFTTEVRAAHQPEPAADPAGPPRADRCEGCTSVATPDGGFCSQDSEVAGRWYCSQQVPSDPDHAALLRQGCARSLSCEVCPGPDGVIYFGDEVRGHVISHNFSLSDVNARGSQRNYSIVVLSADKHLLLRNWSFYGQQLRQIGRDLQTSASRVFDAEDEPLAMEDFPLLVNRPRAPRRRSSQSVKPSRSLAEITGAPDVYRSLHQLFTFVLRSGESRFVPLGGGAAPAARGVSQLPPITTALHTLLGPRLRQLRTELGPENFRDIISHVLVGHQLVLRGRENDVTSVIDAFRLLLPASCYSPLPYSSAYQQPHRCNLLGVPPDARLPAQLAKSVIVARLGDGGEERRAALEVVTARPGPPPTLVAQLDAALANQRLPDALLDHRLASLRQDWKSKSEQLFEYWSGEHGDGGRSQADTQAFIAALGCQPCDLPLLQFWMTSS